jgi:hypothetical protein
MRLTHRRFTRARSTSTPEVDGPWRHAAQGVWLLVTLFALYILAVRLHDLLQHAQTVCVKAAVADCDEGQIARAWLPTLHNLGLPRDALGLYIAGLRIIFEAAYITVGGILIWRKASDRLAVFTAFTLLVFGTITVAGNPQVPPGVPQPFEFVGNALALVGAWMIVVFFYLFPDGRAVLRWPAPLIAAWALVQAIDAADPAWPNGVPGGPLTALTWLAALGAIIYVQIYRYRTLSTPSERQQTKWIIYGMAVGIVGFIGTLGLFNLAGIAGTLLFAVVGTTALYLFLLLIPLAIGFSMLRYRLWDVDVLINRTLVYGLLSVSLAVIYIGGVILLQALFRLVMGQASGLAVAMSTLAIAALFQPFRRGIQSFIDRRFYRRKYDAARTLVAFSAQLRNDVDLGEVTSEIIAVVQDTMQPAHVSLWLR